MSKEKNHINYTAEDIRRYWQNEMSAAEMHALEKAAMEDPFLADALEGYSKVGEDQESHLADLRSRITERAGASAVVSIKRRNYWWRVAAALILLAGVGTLALRIVTDSNKRASLAVTKSESPSPSIATDSVVSQNSAALSESVVDSTKATTPAIASVKKNNNPKSANAGKAADIPQVFIQDTTSDDVASLPRAYETEKQSRRAETDATPRTFNYFSGRVVDSRNNPIPMANVRMNDANVGLTDRNGLFQFKSLDTVATVGIVSYGYNSRNVNLESNRAPENIVLEAEASKQLKEVVVAPSAKKKSESDIKDLKVHVNDAQPVSGWQQFEEYIEKNRKSPTNEIAKSGEVVVTFRVDKEGKLSSFNIEKSLSQFYDAEAMRLIKEGPKWMVTKGKKPRVKVIVKF